jgi:membrane associated rhomboid family serine protease
MSSLFPAFYWLALGSAIWAGNASRVDPRSETIPLPGATRIRYPLITLTLFVLVAIPSVLQFPFPRLLYALRRDGDLTLHHGEWWRVVTALLVQDGGVVGTVSNLVALVLIGLVAERLWGLWLPVLFFGAGICSQFVGLAWQPIGAGNSVGNFGMATGVLLLCVLRAKAVLPRILGVIGIVAGLALLLLRDIHGGAVAIGLVLSALLLASVGGERTARQ